MVNVNDLTFFVVVFENDKRPDPQSMTLASKCWDESRCKFMYRNVLINYIVQEDQLKK